MKKLLFSLALLLSAGSIFAQKPVEPKPADSSIFRGTLYEETYDITLRINLYDNNIRIGGQEFMGEMSGYIDDERDFRNWLIVSSELTSPTAATLQIINDECSEDLEAELTYNAETDSYQLRHLSGSLLKIARNRKWVKLPRTLTFTRTKPKERK